MANENVTPEDLKATLQAKTDDLTEVASEKLDDVKVGAQLKFEELKNVVQNLSLNSRLLAVGAAAVVASAVISRIAARRRTVHLDVDPDQIVIVTAADVS